MLRWHGPGRHGGAVADCGSNANGVREMAGKPKRLSDRAFGLAFAGLFLLVFLVSSYVAERSRVWALPVSGGFAALALLAPGVLMPLNRLWMLITERINLVLNLVLLSVSYALVILPLGLFMKLRRRDALGLDPRPGPSTYWAPSAREITRESFQDLF